MPGVVVHFYCDESGRIPVLEWMDSQPQKAVDKCVVKIERLAQLGFEIRRPEADYLRDGIYELRARYQSVNYRILYFYHGRSSAVLVHALVKEREVPDREITVALDRKRRFDINPVQHTAKD